MFQEELSRPRDTRDNIKLQVLRSTDTRDNVSRPISPEALEIAFNYRSICQETMMVSKFGTTTLDFFSDCIHMISQISIAQCGLKLMMFISQG